jgi:hypothetical protein
MIILIMRTTIMMNAFRARASWGFFDFCATVGHRGSKIDEAFEEGFQSVPVDWGINSDRKRAFFNKVAEISGVKKKLLVLK